MKLLIGIVIKLMVVVYSLGVKYVALMWFIYDGFLVFGWIYQ